MSKIALMSSLALLSSLPLWGNPEGANCISGEAILVNASESTLEVVTSDIAIIEWNHFSIEAHETTRFVMPSSSSAVIVRVSGDLSHISGRLEANGHLFLLNPQGILIGTNAHIITSNFTASSFDILDEPFNSNKTIVFAEDQTESSVINLGEIYATGDVRCFSNYVCNAGTIQTLGMQKHTGKVFLMAEKGLVENGGAIFAQEVQLMGDSVAHLRGGYIDVSGPFAGGTVLIGNDQTKFTYIDSNAIILANATQSGAGGRVIIWSDEGTTFLGTIEAQGTFPGTIDISSAGYCTSAGLTTTNLPSGSK